MHPVKGVVDTTDDFSGVIWTWWRPMIVHLEAAQRSGLPLELVILRLRVAKQYQQRRLRKMTPRLRQAKLLRRLSNRLRRRKLKRSAYAKRLKRLRLPD